MVLCLCLPTCSSNSVSSLVCLANSSNSYSKTHKSKTSTFQSSTFACNNVRQSQPGFIRFLDGCKPSQKHQRRYCIQLEYTFPKKSISFLSRPPRARLSVFSSRVNDQITKLLKYDTLHGGHSQKAKEDDCPALNQSFDKHPVAETSSPRHQISSPRISKDGLLPNAQNLAARFSASVSNNSALGWKYFPKASSGVASTHILTFARFTFLLFVALSLVRIAIEKLITNLKYDGGSDSSRKQKTSTKEKSKVSNPRKGFQAPSEFSFFLEGNVRRKESVEWVNMVLGKLWKVYQRGIENWLVGLLQPLIDNLKKPGYVKRVKVKHFYLGDEPLSVRSVEHRTSRRAHDLQYHIGLRYTGGARMLLSITLKVGIFALPIPVGVRGLDVDGEIWVKLRLIPSEPWVGTATWAFVSLPKITMALAPFGLFNLMAIPFLSTFLTKLLSEDLPRLFVRPNKIVVNFMQGRTLGPAPKDFRDGAGLERTKDYYGELSVTVVDARKLTYFPIGKSDPYVVLMLGDQVIRSKKNSQTSIFGPHGAPIWNQDFQLLVVDPKSERLVLCVRDTVGFTTFTVGCGEVDLTTLQDTVPVDKIVTLEGVWGPLRKRFVGDVVLRLTYKAYVEDEEDDKESGGPLTSQSSDMSDTETHLNSLSLEKASMYGEPDEEVSRRKSFLADLMAAISIAANEQEQTNTFTAYPEIFDKCEAGISKQTEKRNNRAMNKALSTDQNNKSGMTFLSELSEWGKSPGVAWLCLVTGVAVLVALNLDFSSFLNP